MHDIIKAIESAGGRIFQVGGCVRDALMGVKPNDIDFEVFGLSLDSLVDILSRFGKPDLVGKHFGVIKMNGFDFAIPRKEELTGNKHTDFSVDLDPALTTEKACLRRDFTINAIMMTPDGEIVDHFNGVEDIKMRRLMPVSDKFKEDPLRVLRAFQFAGRFQMDASFKLQDMGKELADQFHTISKERIWGEFHKWAEKSVSPSLGLRLLDECGWLRNFPDLFRMKGFIQDKIHHPEGCVLRHTMLVCDAVCDLCDVSGVVDDDKVVLMLAALLHDVGKPDTTFVEDGRIKSPGHAEAGVEIARGFLHAIDTPHHIIDRVLPLINKHMCLIGVSPDKRFVRRLMNKLGKATIPELALLMKADQMGRGRLHVDLLNIEVLEKLHQEIVNTEGVLDNSVKPIIMGRHLLEIGINPGKKMGDILKRLYLHQMNGDFETLEEGLTFVGG